MLPKFPLNRFLAIFENGTTVFFTMSLLPILTLVSDRYWEASITQTSSSFLEWERHYLIDPFFRYLTFSLMITGRHTPKLSYRFSCYFINALSRPQCDYL